MNVNVDWNMFDQCLYCGACEILDNYEIIITYNFYSLSKSSKTIAHAFLR